MTATAGERMTTREIDALAWRLADGVADAIKAALAEPVVDLRDVPQPGVRTLDLLETDVRG